MPELSGDPIHVSTRPELTASRGRLLSGSPHCGTAVHAASFIRDRRIVVGSCLLDDPREFRLILIHELFHFVWARVGNRKRAEFGRILEDERNAHARGELGESAALKKSARPLPGSFAWRDYACESFCDTAAFVYAGFDTHPNFTLAKGWTRRRQRWFSENVSLPRAC